MKLDRALIYFLIILLSLSTYDVTAQKKKLSLKWWQQQEVTKDTLEVDAGKLVIFPDTLIIPEKDTVFIIPSNVKVKIKENPYEQADKFYDSLATKSNKSLITRKLHELLFRSTVTELSDSIRLLRSEAPFEPYKGYRIAEIKITNAQFLGGNIIDTAKVVKSTTVGRAIDAIHVDTKERIVRNSLLFKTGDLVAPFRLADNERILRNLPFIRDARIMILPRKDETVDIYVVTQDRLSLFIGGDFGGFDDFTLKVGSRNIFSTGNQFSVAYQYAEEESQKSGYEIKFKDFNMRGTFISSEITYSDLWDKKGYNVSFQRTFFTPETKWAGGFEFGDLEEIRMIDNEIDSIVTEDDSLRIPYQRNFQDAWFGRAFLINGSEDRTNISIATRLFREEFTSRPYVDADSNHFFHDAVLWLNEVVLTKRKYLKSTMIQAFGVTEDVPIGYLVKLVGGYEYGEFNDRPYLAWGAGVGTFFDGVGYFSALAEVGGYIEDKEFEEGVVSIDGLYFSPLLRFNRNYFRQFVNINYSSTLRPLIDEPFSFREGIRGISREVQGDRKFSVNFESVLFHPLKLYGFRLATYAYWDVGWIGFGGSLITSENFQSAVGIGFRLRNEGLLFRTIQLRFGWITNDGFDVNFSFSDPSIFSNFQTSKPDIVKF